MIEQFIQIAILVLAPYDLPVPHIKFTNDIEVLHSKDVYAVSLCGVGSKTGNPLCHIVLNECMEAGGVTDASEEIFKHELAHYIDYMSDGEMEDHKGEWATIMKDMGLHPEKRIQKEDTPESCVRRRR